MNLLTYYNAAVARGEINDDPLQKAILAPMQRVVDELKDEQRAWFPWAQKRAIQGLYIYGPVGVGKTYLVDLFYQQLEEEKKNRFHFHHFMQQVDVKLRKLQGQKNPLQRLAKELAKSTRVLCFDEFLIHDVAYAMILAELLPALVANGIVLVISSNTAPDDLYLNGVQRARFLPVIALIKNHCDVLYLNEQKDYRLGRKTLIEAYWSPLNEQTQQAMERQFSLLTQEVEENGAINIQNRSIPYLKCGLRSVWFEFAVLCNFPRSQLDYLELADRFDTLFLSGIPVLTEGHTIQVIMFIHFIDVMYDRGIKVVISAAVSVEKLYVQGEMISTFQRTLSRLLEMQSVDYLGRHPRRVIHEMD
ncbi:MAG: cell division protein ZapE [Legionellales bacterium]